MLDYVVTFVAGMIFGSCGLLFIIALFMVGDTRKR